MHRPSLLILIAGITFALPNKIATSETVTKSPIFMLVGGNINDSLRQEFIRLAGNGKIGIIVAASSEFKTRKEQPILWGAKATLIPVFTKDDANSEAIVCVLDGVNAVWFSGGDQLKLAEVCRGTLLERRLKAFVQRGGVTGGSSAGASIFSDVMINKDSYARGLGLLDNLIIDQHFTERKRLARLTKLVSQYKNKIGIGIDETTGIIINGNTMKVRGIGTVTVINKGKIVVLKDNGKSKSNNRISRQTNGNGP